MGRYVGHIGDYALEMGDWVFDYVKDSQPKEYYENFVIDMEFIQYLPGWKEPEHSWSAKERNKHVDDLKIPLLKLGTIKKLKKYYRFTSDFSLQKLVWEEIERRGFIIEGYVGLGDYYTDENGTNVWKYYFLTSTIGEEPIKLQSPTEGVDMLHHLNNYEENMWCIKHGLNFYRNLRI